MKLSEELAWRGFAHQTTLSTPDALDNNTYNFYWGVDPSADSMTIGNLATAMMVRHFINAGHKAVLLVGGATGIIGDPDGKSSERELLSREQIESNKQVIVGQYNQLFDGLEFEIVDNYDWFKAINYIDFLRDIGKHVPIRQMIGRDFVQSRLGDEGSGISYAEFSYSLIQGYDFLHLYKEKNVSLQVCGSDQWGNSVAGVELIRRVAGGEAHVWSAPLVVNKSTGVKFGKTEEGAVWLDPNKTSIFKFYQFWLNVDDEGVVDYLKIFTLLEKQEIDRIIEEFNQNRSARLAQKMLAYEVTKAVHGQERADSVVKATNALFSDQVVELSQNEVDLLSSEIPVIDVQADIVSTLVAAGLASSNSEASRLLESNAISVNGQKVENKDFQFENGYNLLKRGKNSFAIVKKT